MAVPQIFDRNMKRLAYLDNATHTVRDHTHRVDSHTHTISDHTHEIQFGIYEGARASRAVIKVDGTRIDS